MNTTTEQVAIVLAQVPVEVRARLLELRPRRRPSLVRADPSRACRARRPPSRTHSRRRSPHMSTMGVSIIREPEPSMGGWFCTRDPARRRNLGTLYTEPRPSRAEAERISRSGKSSAQGRRSTREGAGRSAFVKGEPSITVTHADAYGTEPLGRRQSPPSPSSSPTAAAASSGRRSACDSRCPPGSTPTRSATLHSASGRTTEPHLRSQPAPRRPLPTRPQGATQPGAGPCGGGVAG